MKEDVDRYTRKLTRVTKSEFERGLSFAEAIGCIEILKRDVLEMMDEEDDGDFEGENDEL